MPRVRATIAIQYHPRRAHLLPALLHAVGPAVVVEDPQPQARRPDPWRTYKLALQAIEPDATHVCIVQDDALPHEGFRDALQAALEARPDNLIALFVGGQPYEHARAMWAASDRGEQWALLPRFRWFPVVAAAWPRRLIRPCLDYDAGQNYPASFTADDEHVGRFLTNTGEVAYATVPSLVEHDDVQPSLIGRRALGGRDRGRVGACQPDPACDLTAIDWT